MSTTATQPGIEALPYQAALLDANGVIVAVNDRWRTFAAENGGSRRLRDGVGIDYLAVCRGARGPFAEEGSLAATAIVGALSGGRTWPTFRYPCHSPSLQRWYVYSTSISPAHGVPKHVLVSHVDVSNCDSAQRPMAFGSQGASPDGWSHPWTWQPSEGGLTQRLQFQLLQEATATGCWEADASLQFFKWTPECCRIFETTQAAFTPTFMSMISLFKRRDRHRLESLFLQLAHAGASFDVELASTTLEGRPLWLRVTGRAETSGVRVRRLYGLIRDITARRELQGRTDR